MRRAASPPPIELVQSRPLVAAFDLSTTKTGAVVLRGDEVLTAKRISPPKDINGLRRICWVRDSVLAELDGLSTPPAAVFVEDFAFAQANRAHELGGLGYVVRESLLIADYSVFVVPIAVNKKFCTGKGNAAKSMMLLGCYKRWRFDTDDDNIADAYSLARVGQAFLGAGDTQRVRDIKRKVREEVI